MTTFIESELQFQDDPLPEQFPSGKKTWKSIICSQFAKGIFIAFIIAVLIPTVAYYCVISRNVTYEDENELYYCLIQEEYRVPCGPPNISQGACEQAFCCFNRTTEQCHQFLPSKYFFKNVDNKTYTASQETTPYGSKSIPNLQFAIQEKSANKLSLIIHDPSEIVESVTIPTKNYLVNQSTKRLILEVSDTEGDVIFSTAKGSLIASEYYWEWAFQLTNETIFGLDRNIIALTGNESLTKVVYKNQEDHSTLPVFWAYQNGKFHGCVVNHDGPLEIQVIASNIIILRSLLGKKIEVELYLGPTPLELYTQLAEGTVLPPLWTMGTHNCRNSDTIKLKDILKVYADNKGFTFDNDCLHKNLFMAMQHTNNSDEDLASLKTALEEMVANGTKFLLSLPPHIIINELNPLYTAAKQQDILYKYQSGIIYNGSYLDQAVVYPDYTDQHIDVFIKILVDWIKEKFGVENISGFVLNDNWPQDDAYKNVEKIDFPYYTDDIDAQMKYTLPWTLNGSDGLLHLEKHNSYGSAQYKALDSYLKTSTDLANLVIISATKNFGDTEPEISENFETSWDNLKMYLNKIIFNSITGNHMVGLPVCGDSKSYKKALQETLCLRWYIAAATMPYFQVSSGTPFRDPANLNSKFATRIAKLATDRREQLLDYFYTILDSKEPLVRPMYYNYYSNSTTFSMERQYTLGSEIIITHPFSNGKTILQVYLPPEKGKWYEFWGGGLFTPERKNGYIIEIDTLETDWTMFVAQGNIVALTNASQINLHIALNCTSECAASGRLLKDNNQLTLTANSTSVTISNIPVSCNYTLGYLKVYGYIDTTGYSTRHDENITLCDTSNNTVTYCY